MHHPNMYLSLVGNILFVFVFVFLFVFVSYRCYLIAILCWCPGSGESLQCFLHSKPYLSHGSGD